MVVYLLITGTAFPNDNTECFHHGLAPGFLGSARIARKPWIQLALVDALHLVFDDATLQNWLLRNTDTSRVQTTVYPVVHGGKDKRSVLGYSYSRKIFPIQWETIWSYLEFPNHLIAVYLIQFHWFGKPKAASKGQINKITCNIATFWIFLFGPKFLASFCYPCIVRHMFCLSLNSKQTLSIVGAHPI